MAFTGMAKVSHQILSKTLKQAPSAFAVCGWDDCRVSSSLDGVRLLEPWLEQPFPVAAGQSVTKGLSNTQSWSGEDCGSCITASESSVCISLTLSRSGVGDQSAEEVVCKRGFLSQRGTLTPQCWQDTLASVELVLSWARCYRFLS